MKILLISANTETINMPVLPLGLAFVNAALTREGFDTLMINLMGEADTDSLLGKTITEFMPHAIGISVRNIDDQNMNDPKFMLDPVKKIIEKCRLLTRAPIILGGAGYSIFPQTALDFLSADIGIKGDGETSLPILLRKLAAGESIEDIPGVYLPGTAKRVNPKCPATTINTPYPIPGIDLPVPDTIKTEDLWMPFQTRRGCPMNCSYCSTASIEGRIIRKFSPDLAIKSLTEFADAGFHQFFFVDNLFNLPASYANALCDRIISQRLNIKWRAILYPYKISESLILKMAEAGCCEVALGFESGSDPILKNFNKQFTTADIKKISDVLKAAGIRRMGFLLLGGPAETEKTVTDSLLFADHLKLDSLKITCGIRIYPDTLLAETARQEKVIDTTDELLVPKFYVRHGMKDWIRRTVMEWVDKRPHWIFY